jgi:hypothetical protein
MDWEAIRRSSTARPANVLAGQEFGCGVMGNWN